MVALDEKLDAAKTSPETNDISREKLEKLAADYKALSTPPAKAKEDKKEAKEPDSGIYFYEKIQSIISARLKDANSDSIKKDDLLKKAEASFTEREESLTGETQLYKTKTDRINTQFELAIEKIYGLKNVSLKSQPNPLMSLFFSDEGGLYVVYKLIMLTLTAIVVFSLLFLILIPLRNIFFLESSTETIIDKAKGIIELIESKIGLGGTAGALLATVATVGIGVAAIAGTPSLISWENTQNDSQNNAETSNNLNYQFKKTEPPTKPGTDNTNGDNNQLIIDELTSRVSAMNQNIEILNGRIKNWQPVVIGDGSGKPPDLTRVE
jgi:hypothetical protein